MSLKKLKEKSKEFNPPQEIIDDRENGRLAFISKFPLDELKSLSIDQFVQGTDKDSFCHWLEFKNILFGIGGGNVSKHGLYKKDDGNYYTNYGKNIKQLTGSELNKFFSNIKSGILQALKYTENNEIEEIKTIELPLWNMVIQKFLSIYFPDKFLTIGSADVLIECARDIKLEGIELTPENSIQINYELKKLLDSLPEFISWSYEKIGSFIWESYIDDSKRNYYILGSKYGDNNDKDIFPIMFEKKGIAIGFASNINLDEYYSKKHSEITEFLKEKGENQNSYNALKYFLNLKVGDRIAVKADGSPKGKKGFLSIIGVAEVIEKDGEIYRYEPNGLGHIINVKFIKAPVYREFELGGYGRTIHKLSKTDHIDMIFKCDYEIVDLQSIQKGYRLEFTNWLNKKYSKDTGTTSSYIKAIDNLSEILSKDLFKSTDDNYLENLYRDLIKEQKNTEGKYYLVDSPSYGSNGFYSASIKSYREFLKAHQNKAIKRVIQMNNPKNQILYGPPGTGKTYYLKDQLFDKYTSKETSISKEKHFENIVGNCSWWQVIAIALLEMAKSKVTDIFEHKWVQTKASLSNSNTVRPTIWGQLQSHTIDECEFVNVAKRMTPQIFTKTEDSYWEVVEDQVNELTPELFDLVNSVDNYNPDPDKVIKHYRFVTFHQSFAYEDFIEGIKPIFPEGDENVKDLGYKVEDGVFKEICFIAENDPDNRYAIFIDEINRGNVSAIFGELITLIETDKRKGAQNEMSITMPYSKKDFSVPLNLDIYGTMNTADRSVEALDTALRRRFEFKEMMPDLSVIADEEIEGIMLSDVLKTMNQRIELLIDRDHTIGHSYFVNVNSKEALAKAFNNKILPLLQEFFYGDYGKIGLVLGEGFVEKKKNDGIPFANFVYENSNDFKNPSFTLKEVNNETVIEAVTILLNKVETS